MIFWSEQSSSAPVCPQIYTKHLGYNIIAKCSLPRSNVLLTKDFYTPDLKMNWSQQWAAIIAPFGREPYVLLQQSFLRTLMQRCCVSFAPYSRNLHQMSLPRPYTDFPRGVIGLLCEEDWRKEGRRRRAKIRSVHSSSDVETGRLDLRRSVKLCLNGVWRNQLNFLSYRAFCRHFAPLVR